MCGWRLSSLTGKFLDTPASHADEEAMPVCPTIVCLHPQCCLKMWGQSLLHLLSLLPTSPSAIGVNSEGARNPSPAILQFGSTAKGQATLPQIKCMGRTPLNPLHPGLGKRGASVPICHMMTRCDGHYTSVMKSSVPPARCAEPGVMARGQATLPQQSLPQD